MSEFSHPLGALSVTGEGGGGGEICKMILHNICRFYATNFS